jgi:hypothetical protein
MVRLLALVLSALLLSPVLCADESADKFLASLKDVNPDVCVTSRYSVKVAGRKVGTFVLKVGQAEYEGGPCYRVDVTAELMLPDGSRFTREEAGCVTPDLRLLHFTARQQAGEADPESESVLLTGNGYVLSKLSGDGPGELKGYTFDNENGLILKSAGYLLPILLPRDPDQTYVFKNWNADLGIIDETVKVGGTEDGWRTHRC